MLCEEPGGEDSSDAGTKTNIDKWITRKILYSIATVTPSLWLAVVRVYGQLSPYNL